MSFKIPDTPEELFRQGQNNLNNFGKFLPLLALVIVILAVLATSFYTISPNEVGIIRRFGKYVRTADPGLNFKLPLNIEKLDKVKVRFPYKEEFGFRTLSAGVSTKYSKRQYTEESLMLTGDLSVIDVAWTVEFKIKDPVKLLFNIRGPRETVRDLSEAVMRQIVGDSSVSEALTIRRDQIAERAQEQLQKVLDEYGSGIHIETVKLQDVNVPPPVQKSFNEVNEAEQEKERMINEAWEAYNKIIPRARGQAEKTISEAEGYAIARINKAEGEANKFLETWKAYKEAKKVTRRRLYLETLETIIPNAGKKYVFEPQANNVLPLLNLTGGANE